MYSSSWENGESSYYVKYNNSALESCKIRTRNERMKGAEDSVKQNGKKGSYFIK